MAGNYRFGDARSRQSKIQKHRQSEIGTGKRRSDPSIHATSRPWHTSTPGIKMNVTTLGQIAARDKVAAKYLNKMNLSEMAQKKRGIAESEMGRGFDKMGMAMGRGLKHSVKTQRGMNAPNQDRINMWQAHLSQRIVDAPTGGGTSYDKGPSGGGIVTHDDYVNALRGMKKKLPKSPYHYTGHNMYHKYQY